MLTDIFAIRYEKRLLFRHFGEAERRALHQLFTLLEDIHPYWGEAENQAKASQKFWQDIHKRVSNEIGQRWLSEPFYETFVGLGQYRRTESQMRAFIEIVRNWYNTNFSEELDPDAFIKRRLSAVEIGMRLLDETTEATKALLKGGLAANAETKNNWEEKIRVYECAVSEVNTRFKLAGLNLHYHNGFIQILSDNTVSDNVEQPFWDLVNGVGWKNVDFDMKEALDQRDTGGKDPAFHATKALESAIKIVSENLGVTHGRERGAHSYIDNLSKKSVGFFENWEAEILKQYFTCIRNPLGHGPGSADMQTLDYDQSSWAIEVAMCWIKLIIVRFKSWNGKSP